MNVFGLRGAHSKYALLFAMSGIAFVGPLFWTGCANGHTSVINSHHLSILEENRNPGTTHWQITHPASNEIEGYPSSPSVPEGGQIDFMVNTASSEFTIQIFRLGWYGGLGGRAMTLAVTVSGTQQPAPLVDKDTGLIECPWSSSYSLQVPENWTSGIYLAKLTTAGTFRERYIPFVVTDPSSTAKILYDVPVFTYQAYNGWGGKSLYPGNSTDQKAAYKVTLRRPYDGDSGAGQVLEGDIDDIRFLEKHGYDVTYETDEDLHLDKIDLTRHAAWVEMAHPEYWTRPMRGAVTRARDAGIHLGFFSANEMFWQVRLETSPLTGEPNSTIVCYRSAALDPDAQDPSTAYLTTVQWRESPVNEPEEALMGSSYGTHVDGSSDLVVRDGTSWVFANTGLGTGDHVANVIGDEINYFHGWGPGNTVLIAHSPATATSGGYLTYSDMTWYQADSGAVVFNAGTVNLGFGLEPYNPKHNLGSPQAAAAVQQIVTNVLGRFGAQPAM